MNSVHFVYDESYRPAMPVVDITVDGYDGRRPVTLKALVDSGADGTMLPIDALQAVNALFEDTVFMRGVLGESEPVDRYTVAIQIGPLTVNAVHAVSIPAGEECIVGRDVLNSLVMTLNGPANTTQIELEV